MEFSIASIFSWLAHTVALHFFLASFHFSQAVFHLFLASLDFAPHLFLASCDFGSHMFLALISILSWLAGILSWLSSILAFGFS
jgi:hypothetical protein